MESGTTTIWLARHGHVHNPTHILYGRLPRMRLSGEGTRQARATADFLAHRTLAAIYTSPMLRARATARAIQERHSRLPLRRTRDLQEVRTGWQGSTYEKLATIEWDFYQHPRFAEDETAADIRHRMRRWTERVLRRHPGSEVVGVSHGDPILILVADLQGLPLEPARFRPVPYIATGSMFRLTFDASGLFKEARLLVPHQAAEPSA